MTFSGILLIYIHNDPDVCDSLHNFEPSSHAFNSIRYRSSVMFDKFTGIRSYFNCIIHQRYYWCNGKDASKKYYVTIL